MCEYRILGDSIYSFTGGISLGSCSQVEFRAFTATLVATIESNHANCKSALFLALLP